MSLPRRRAGDAAMAGAAAGRGGEPPVSDPSSPPSSSQTDNAAAPPSLPRLLWKRRVPLIITHAALADAATTDAALSSSSPPPLFFATSIPRFGYLAQLLPRLSAFFGRPCSSFFYENVPLRNLPVGLLLDLYQPPGRRRPQQPHGEQQQQQRQQLPWRLVVGDGDAWHLGDTFLNGAKEADYVRYGSAKQILGLSKANTEALWHAVQDNDYAAFARVNSLLLNAPTPLKHIPLRIYIPSSAPPPITATTPPMATAAPAPPGAYKVLQALVTPRSSTSASASTATPALRPQTQTLLGPTLRRLLPQLFPSSRDPVLAHVILHGAPVPFSTPLEALMREAAYPDGWLCLIVVLL